MEQASFAAGCFWGVEAAFRQLKGVASTTVGYSGGTLENPTYEDVYSNTTGHAETVLVEFDPTAISYEQLLETFWNCHDPTQRDRQGPDVGTQYRSAIFYHTPEQQATAIRSKESLERSGKHRRPIVTEISPTATFYRAKSTTSSTLEKRGQASCHVR